ncbi:GntR family transcriptional regulator [Streptomyces sp. NPDC005917]|uniref:GntR family transcriptional regulator n=1 Tax=unclassified Streptomyces TaxID=2593676 RepID=UPI0033F36A26
MTESKPKGTAAGTGLRAVGQLPAEARHRTYEHVYRTLRRALVTGQIPEGTHLVETELAAQLGVSRTPVRDALRRLQSDGFAERGPAGGLWSRAIDTDSIQDLFLVREELDKLAARLACERAKPEQWEEPRALIAAMAEAIAAHGPASDAFSQAHLAFHTSIYRIAFGARFAGLLDNHMLQYLEIAADLSYRAPALNRPAVEQHEELLAELTSGDVTRAVAAAQAHVRRSATDAHDARTDSLT